MYRYGESHDGAGGEDGFDDLPLSQMESSQLTGSGNDEWDREGEEEDDGRYVAATSTAVLYNDELSPAAKLKNWTDDQRLRSRNEAPPRFNQAAIISEVPTSANWMQRDPSPAVPPANPFAVALKPAPSLLSHVPFSLVQAKARSHANGMQQRKLAKFANAPTTPTSLAVQAKLVVRNGGSGGSNGSAPNSGSKLDGSQAGQGGGEGRYEPVAKKRKTSATAPLSIMERFQNHQNEMEQQSIERALRLGLPQPFQSSPPVQHTPPNSACSDGGVAQCAPQLTPPMPHTPPVNGSSSGFHPQPHPQQQQQQPQPNPTTISAPPQTSGWMAPALNPTSGVNSFPRSTTVAPTFIPAPAPAPAPQQNRAPHSMHSSSTYISSSTAAPMPARPPSSMAPPNAQPSAATSTRPVSSAAATIAANNPPSRPVGAPTQQQTTWTPSTTAAKPAWTPAPNGVVKQEMHNGKPVVAPPMQQMQRPTYAPSAAPAPPAPRPQFQPAPTFVPAPAPVRTMAAPPPPPAPAPFRPQPPADPVVVAPPPPPRPAAAPVVSLFDDDDDDWCVSDEMLSVLDAAEKQHSVGPPQQQQQQPTAHNYAVPPPQTSANTAYQPRPATGAPQPHVQNQHAPPSHSFAQQPPNPSHSAAPGGPTFQQQQQHVAQNFNAAPAGPSYGGAPLAGRTTQPMQTPQNQQSHQQQRPPFQQEPPPSQQQWAQQRPQQQSAPQQQRSASTTAAQPAHAGARSQSFSNGNGPSNPQQLQSAFRPAPQQQQQVSSSYQPGRPSPPVVGHASNSSTGRPTPQSSAPAVHQQWRPPPPHQPQQQQHQQRPSAPVAPYANGNTAPTGVAPTNSWQRNPAATGGPPKQQQQAQAPPQRAAAPPAPAFHPPPPMTTHAIQTPIPVANNIWSSSQWSQWT